MKVKKHDNATENRVLTAMIVNDSVCNRIAAKWVKDGLFRSRWANLVAGWCVTYCREYGQAPKGHIEDTFDAWADRQGDKDELVDLVDTFLAGLSEDYEATAAELNPDYVVDQAGAHFNEVALEHMAAQVQDHISRGEQGKATKLVTKFAKVELGVGAAVDLLRDHAAMEEAFEAKSEPLVTYPGDIGKFFGDQLGRDEFVAITGATGRGKTWWLLDIAWQAVKQKRRVAFFEVGDMSQAQILRRFACRATGRPLKPPYEFDYPTAIHRGDEQELPDVETEHRSYPGPLTAAQAVKAMQGAQRRKTRGDLRVSVHPNSSISVAGIRAIMDGWQRSEGWVPDVVLVDYADILAAPPGYTPGDREAINQTWKELRNMSQEIHGLVVTATQADAASYTAQTISRSNFSDDRRKNDHVTGMLGINANEEEQNEGIYRLNWTKRREEAYSESRCVYVAGCLHAGRPHVKSTF